MISGRWCTAGLVGILGFIGCPPAKADLQSDVSRLQQALSGARPYRLGPRLLEQGEELPLLIPAELREAPQAQCLHVVALAAENIHFSCEVPDNENAAVEDLPSRGGLLEVVRCGPERANLAAATLTMFSPRGLVEVLAFASHGSKVQSRDLLPSRAVGIEQPERQVERQNEAPPIEAWLRQLERNATLQRATRTEQRRVPATDKKLGETWLGFDAGCHELRMLTSVDWQNQQQPSGATLEVIWEDSDEPVVQSELTSRAPTLRICTEEARSARLRFPPLAAAVDAVVFRARYPFAQAIPGHWAIPARQRMALAFTRMQLASASEAALAGAWMGQSTQVRFGFPLVARGCYLAVVASTASNAGDLALSVQVAGRWFSDGSVDGGFANVAFCPDREQAAQIEVDAQGSTSPWILGLWHVGQVHIAAD